MFERNQANERTPRSSTAIIKVIGVGGGGGNAVNYMVENGLEGVEFIVTNTDSQALDSSSAHQVIQIGANLTKGLGAGTNPDVGRNAAMEDRQGIEEALKGTDMLFITTGMGGGTGTGATPIIAEIAKSMGILTVAVVTRPFPFEGKRRERMAEDGIRQLALSVDSLITIPNEKLLTILGKDASLISAFAKADDVLCSAVRGISDIINRPGMINVDFADVRAVMSEMGMALMGTGCSSGPNRAREATEAAVHNPLLANVNLMGARGILVNITAGSDLTMGEYADVGSIIEEFASDDAIVKIGTVVDANLRDEMHVTVVATGLDLSEEMNHTKAPQSRTHAQRQDQRAPSIPLARDTQRDAMHNQSSMGIHEEIQSRNNDFTHEQHGIHDHQRSAHRATNVSQPRRTLSMPSSHGQLPHADRRTNNRDMNDSMPIAAYQDPRTSRTIDNQRELAKPSHNDDMDYLDIPAFLRRDKTNM